MEANHTPEPWHVYQGRGANPRLHIGGSDSGNAIFSTPELSRDPRDKEANLARLADCDRAVACVNALAGLNPDAVAGVVAALEEIKSARDYYAQEGVYPEKIHVQYQCCFDDWAADLADDALAAFRGEVQP